MTNRYADRFELAAAFPSFLRPDALRAAARFPETRVLGQSFSVRVADEEVTIPSRLHNNPVLVPTIFLSGIQKQLVNCLLTRHSDGLVRERHLVRIVGSNNPWVPPFVIQLVGEYVVEILRVVHQSLERLDPLVYANFLGANPQFLAKTERRVMSYWDCYYRNQKREEYVGFKLLSFFQGLLNKNG